MRNHLICGGLLGEEARAVSPCSYCIFHLANKQFLGSPEAASIYKERVVRKVSKYSILACFMRPSDAEGMDGPSSIAADVTCSTNSLFVRPTIVLFGHILYLPQIPVAIQLMLCRNGMECFTGNVRIFVNHFQY